jgi:hypothetical protein
MSDKLFDVPNLDDMSVDPEDYREAARVLRALADYCERKGRAIQNRFKGNILSTGACDRECRMRYKDLPEWARW